MKSDSTNRIFEKIDIVYILEEFLFITKEAVLLNYQNLEKQTLDNYLDSKECIIVCNFIQMEILNFLKLYYAMYYKLIKTDYNLLEKSYDYLTDLLDWKNQINCHLNQPRNGYIPFFTTILEEHSDLKEKYIEYMKKYKKDLL